MDYPVTLVVPDSDDEIVLIDYMAATPDHGNLARVRADGTEVWRVTPAIEAQDAWTVARVEAGVCRASTWSGWDVTLDLAEPFSPKTPEEIVQFDDAATRRKASPRAVCRRHVRSC